MQKRGIMVDAEDFRAVTDTYPKHPLSDIKPAHKTQVALKHHRHAVEKADLKQKKDAQDSKVAHLQKVQFKDYYQPQEFVQNPRYNATWEMKEDDRKMWRARNGLASDNIDVNPEALKAPSLKWIDKQDKTGLREKKRADLIKELQKCEANFDHHLDGQARIEEREACIYRLTFKGLDTVTWNTRALK